LEALSHRLESLSITADSIKQIHDDVAKMREIIEAWDNAKGFVTTIKFLSALVKWLTIVGGAVGVIWYALTHNQLPPPR